MLLPSVALDKILYRALMPILFSTAAACMQIETILSISFLKLHLMSATGL